MNLSYQKWWLVNVCSLDLSHPLAWRHSIYRSFKDLFFHHKYGIHYGNQWDAYVPIAEHVLRTTWWMGQKTCGYPSSLLEEYTQDKASEKWDFILHEIRFAFFYAIFIANEDFSYKIHTEEDRTNCLKWAQKKFWYASDFLTEDFFKKMYPVSGPEFKYSYIQVEKDLEPRYEAGMKLFTEYFMNLWDQITHYYS